jgi:hypothetical protein
MLWAVATMFLVPLTEPWSSKGPWFPLAALLEAAAMVVLILGAVLR